MVRLHTEAVVRLCNERGITPQYQGVSQVLGGWTEFADGQSEVGVAAMRAGVEGFRRIGAGLRLSCYLCLLAEAYLEIDEVEQGLRIIAEADAFVKRTGERTWQAEIQRLKGELLLSQPVRGGKNEAEPCISRAIEIARRQEAKALELRAVTSLSRLWRNQGRNSEARELLTPIYAWFREGLETADLNNARALLSELGQPRQELQRAIRNSQ